MLHALSRFFTLMVRRYLPDAYLFAVLLTFVTFVAAWLWTLKTPVELVRI